MGGYAGALANQLSDSFLGRVSNDFSNIGIPNTNNDVARCFQIRIACSRSFSNSNKNYIPGTSIAVDELMVRYTGRSKETTTVPTKPIPTGFKAWAVAQRGYFLQWLWQPGSPYGAIPIKIGQKRKRNLTTKDPEYLNPTQVVVPLLINRLAKQTYHVYLDNLFSSPKLFLALRKLGTGATGTCRVNCGIYKPLADAKALDKTGGLKWARGELKAVPIPDNLVRLMYLLLLA
jgi:hypothetical protein